MGTDSSVGFRGFMIQGRIVADNSPIGTWQVQVSDARSMCSGRVSYITIFNHHKMLS